MMIAALSKKLRQNIHAKHGKLHNLPILLPNQRFIFPKIKK